MMHEIDIKKNTAEKLVLENDKGINFQKFCDLMGYDKQTLAVPNMRQTVSTMNIVTSASTRSNSLF